LKKSKIRVGIFDGLSKNIRFEIVDNDLQTWYDIIDCRCIDIVEFAGFDLICDDEALLYGEHKPTVLRYDNEDNLISSIYGTVVICRNSDEELDSLTVSDIEWLIDNIMILNLDINEDERYAMVDTYRYRNFFQDMDLMQFDNFILLNDEDIY
jgi:hypothetical protein